MSYTRRGLLRAAGLAGTAMLAGDVLARRASAVEAPQRLLILLTPNGTMYDQFHMLPEGRSNGVREADWEVPLGPIAEDRFSSILQPWHRVRDRISVFDGLSNYVAAAGDWFVGVHAFGQSSILSGSRPVTQFVPGLVKAFPGSRTLDQLVADHLSRADRLHSIRARVGFEPATFSASVPGEAVAFVDDPRRLYAQLFPSRATTGEHGAALDRARPRVHELVQSRFERALQRASAIDRERLTAHRDLLADTDRRMAALLGVECPPYELPNLPRGGYTTSLFQSGWNADDAYEACYGAFRDLIVTAFACDLTRVAVLDIGEMPGSLFGAPRNMETHFGIAHFADDFQEIEKRGWMRTYHRVHAERVVSFVERLAATPDAGGGSLLDNTTVLWTSEVGSGSHRFWNLPAIVAGGRGHRAGRYRRFQPALPAPVHPNSPRPDAVSHFGAPHNRLLAALGRSFGLDMPTFGETSIRGVRDETGRNLDVDLTGSIDLA